MKNPILNLSFLEKDNHQRNVKPISLRVEARVEMSAFYMLYWLMPPSERPKQALNISCNVRLSTDLNHGDPRQLKFSTPLLDITILFVSLVFQL